MLTPPETFTTERLVLRRVAPSDAPAVFRNYAQDPEVVRFLLWRPHTSLAETESFLRNAVDWWEAGKEFNWVISLRGTDEAIGMIGAAPKNFKVEVGYVLARDYWGRGIMTEAGRAVVDWLRSREEIWRIGATCHVENLASARVLEKLGMEREGVLRRWNVYPNLSPEPQDSFIYAWVRSGARAGNPGS